LAILKQMEKSFEILQTLINAAAHDEAEADSKRQRK
jgi:hypothetical protein